jgi:hypothetical protein
MCLHFADDKGYSLSVNLKIFRADAFFLLRIEEISCMVGLSADGDGRMSKAKVGDERWTAEHVSYKAWCDLARARGWNGEDDSDGLREYCGPEEAATVTFHASLAAAAAWAKETFKTAPEDTAFGAILIDHQILEAAHDDSRNLVRGCKPEWNTVRIYEVASDGEMLDAGTP